MVLILLLFGEKKKVDLRKMFGEGSGPMEHLTPMATCLAMGGTYLIFLSYGFCYRFIVFFSMVVPDIDLVINLTGAMCLSIVGVALPAIINHLTFYNERRMQGRWAYFLFCLKNIFIVLVGISAMFIGTTTSMKDIINKMYNIKS